MHWQENKRFYKNIGQQMCTVIAVINRFCWSLRLLKDDVLSTAKFVFGEFVCNAGLCVKLSFSIGPE